MTQLPRYRYRLYLLTLLVLVGLGALLTRLHDFQINRTEHFRSLTPQNYTVKVREPGIRGDIYDRNGIKLAENTYKYAVYFNLEEIANAYKETNKKKLSKEVIVTRKGSPRKIKRTDIVAMVNELIRPKLAELGLDAPYSSRALASHFRSHGGLVPFLFRSDLTFDEFSTFAEKNRDIPGVYVSVIPERKYPYGSLASHVLGFIKPWKKGNIPKDFRHFVGDPYGEDGVEKTMNDALTGLEGVTTILKSEKGKTLRVVDRIKPAKGSDVTLTIDARVQYLTEMALRKAGKAAAVVMDARNGEILAMASVPDYDPNDFIPSISRKRYAFYRDNTAAPLINRAIRSFAPGSTFKLPTAIAGCKYGLHRHTHNCIGYTQYGKDTRIKCWLHSGHGRLSLAGAIQRSCNPFFMNYANTIGSRKMAEVFLMLGFGKRTLVELPHESTGSVPATPAWFKKYPNERVTPAVTGMISIGQGSCEATPIQLTSAVSAIANGGKLYQPHLIKSIANITTRRSRNTQPQVLVDLLKEGIEEKHLTTIRYGMRLAAHEIGGTAGRAAPQGILIGAKTGTAQTADLGIRTHVAWTAAFAPYEDPRYVVVVAVKRGGSGGAVAGPIVKLILTGLFEQEAGRKLPIAVQKPYKGHQKLIKEITLPNENILSSVFPEGETGNEAENIDTPPVKNEKQPTPQPEITPEIDAGGSLPKPNSRPN